LASPAFSNLSCSFSFHFCMFLQPYWLASYSLTSHCLHQSLYNCIPKSSWYSLPAWPLNLGALGCPQMLADNYQSTPCNSPEGQRS
jgi:hypothetical protein